MARELNAAELEAERARLEVLAKDVDGETTDRIYSEVCRGIIYSEKDTPAERACRRMLRISVQQIVESGGMLHMPTDWP